MKNNIIQTFKIIIAALVLSFGVSYVYAWVGPPDAPPDCTDLTVPGCNAPLNVGDNSQLKLGQLILNTDTNNPVYDMGLAVFGKVGIGTTNPQATLHIAGDGEMILEDTSTAITFLDTTDDDFRIKPSNKNAFNIDSDVGSTGVFDTKFTIKSNWRVGIGTTTPETVLHLQTANNTELLKLTSNKSAEIIFNSQFENPTGADNFSIVTWKNKFVVESSSIKNNSSSGNGDIMVLDGNTGKLIMKSPDGSYSACGPTNNDSWSCSSVVYP